MEKLSFRVAEYDAPLDLILHLISKHKLNITDIDISSLLAQYMEVISSWQKQDLEVTSEFLEMASRLVYMKTVSLLPRHEEEIERLRQDLTGQLMEYRMCKMAAEMLGSESLYSDIFVRRPMALEIDMTYKNIHPPNMLFEALADALGRGARRLPPPRDSFEPLVARPVVSVTAKIFTLLRRLRGANSVHYAELFQSDEGRSAIVATFLALLELVRSGGVVMDEDSIRLGKRRTQAT